MAQPARAFNHYQPPPAPPPRSRASAAFLGLHIIGWVAALVQLIIDRSYDNLIGIVLVLASSTLTLLYLQRSRALTEVPLSSMAVLGLCMTTQWGALVGQSMLGDSLTTNLRVPLQTFGYLLGFQCVAVAAHWVSRRLALLMAVRRAGAEMLLRPLGIFATPSVHAVWAIGCLGLLAILGGRALSGTLLGKMADGVAVFAWAPFAIPMLHARLGEAYCRMRLQLPFIIGFGGLAALLALAFNGRSLMLVGVVTAALLVLLLILSDDRPFHWRQLRSLALAALLAVLIFQPLGYFLLAMQAARAERDKLTRIEMIEHTFRVARDPVAVQREGERVLSASDTASYDEVYFSSLMLGRLVETKFHDNGFFMVDGVSPLESRLVADDAVERMWSILPFPVLRWFEMERAKYVTLYSAGDLLSYLRLGVELGTFRTGSMFAQLIAIFGVWTPLLYFVLCIPMFIVWDVLCRPVRRGVPAVISLVGMLLIYRVFAYGVVSESIGNLMGVLLRFQLQTLLLYALVLAATRLIWKPFDGRADDGGPAARAGPAAGAAT